MNPDELAICVDVLFHKKWGRTLVGGQLKSKSWWEKHKKDLIESPAIKIEPLWDSKTIDIPITYEEEMGLK
jgi:hypothetical protein